ncbi:MAG: hypothetical protein OXF27_10480, partial [Acidobacteria bacterium]|nr:hypothetical protein [Acidobacteriota bacterium]
LALPGLAAAQQPDHIAFHGLASFYTEDADPHLGAGVSWHKHVGRNWGLNVEYDFTSTAATASRQRAHSDHVLWLGVMKSLGPPDRSVPYIVIGAAAFYRHTLVPGAAGATGFGPTLGVGVGRRHWNKSRRWFIAPEARLLINAHLTASVALGFRL